MGKSKAGGKQPSSSVPTPHIWGKHHIEPLFWDIAGPKIRHRDGQMSNKGELESSIADAMNEAVEEWGADVRKEAAREDLTAAQLEQVQLQLKELDSWPKEGVSIQQVAYKLGNTKTKVCCRTLTAGNDVSA